jgi:hypothetical protein
MTAASAATNRLVARSRLTRLRILRWLVGVSRNGGNSAVISCRLLNGVPGAGARADVSAACGTGGCCSIASWSRNASSSAGSQPGSGGTSVSWKACSGARCRPVPMERNGPSP